MGNLNLKETNYTNINSQNQSYSSNSKNSINQNYSLNDIPKVLNQNTNMNTYDYFRNQPNKFQQEEDNLNQYLHE